jgi:riboflavin-specific deaminase-like protein
MNGGNAELSAGDLTTLAACTPFLGVVGASEEASVRDLAAAWRFLLDLRSARPGVPAVGRADAFLASRGLAGGITRDGSGAWKLHGRPLAGPAEDLLDLYLPYCDNASRQPLAVGHLGQSLDGRIATESGVSRYVTGPENIVHLHRMRALCDAVVVGAETVRHDNPLLTTRLVPGDNPVRVVVDPRRRLAPSLQVFTGAEARTLLICEERWAREAPPSPCVEVLGVPTVGTHLDLRVLCQILHEAGLRVLFVEGGGITVSRFLQQGLLDRLQIAVAPIILGSGRHGLTLPVVSTLDEALRPRARIFRMGRDVLFDCDLRGVGPDDSEVREEVAVADREP